MRCSAADESRPGARLGGQQMKRAKQRDRSRRDPARPPSEAPVDLLAEARQRLSYFAFAAGLASLVAGGLVASGLDTVRLSLRVALTLSFGGYALVVAALARSGAVPTHRILDLAFLFQLFGSVVLAALSNARPWHVEAGVPSWSAIAVFALLAPIVIPTTTPRALLGAVFSAAADPVAMLISVRVFGAEMPSGMDMAMRFGPEIATIPIAVIVARIVHRLGERLAVARDMGSYRLIAPLGGGGTSEVWRAAHRQLRREAAVKIIRLDGLSERAAATARARFEREARAVAELRSPHTIHLYDYGTAADGTLFMVLELVEGWTLEALVAREGPAPAERVVHVLRQVAASLAEAHGRGLVHRDIKPANILLARYGGVDDLVKVLDFGLVRELVGERRRLTLGDAIVGTPAYLSPEAATGGEVDARSDLYALGCVGYFLLTGELVFAGRSALETAVAHATRLPISPSRRLGRAVPAALEAVVLRCLRKSPEDRFASARELDAALVAIPLADPWTALRARAWWDGVERTHEAGEPIAAPASSRGHRGNTSRGARRVGRDAA